MSVRRGLYRKDWIDQAGFRIRSGTDPTSLLLVAVAALLLVLVLVGATLFKKVYGFVTPSFQNRSG